MHTKVRKTLWIRKFVTKIHSRGYQELMQADGYITAAKLKYACPNIRVKQKTLLKLFEQHNS